MIRADKMGVLSCPECGKKPIIVHGDFHPSNYNRMIACPDYKINGHQAISINLKCFKHSKETLYWLWNKLCIEGMSNEPTLKKANRNPSKWVI